MGSRCSSPRWPLRSDLVRGVASARGNRHSHGGATPGSVVGLVLTPVATVLAAGVAIGAGLSIWASQLLGSLLYGLQPRDPATLAGAAIVLAFVAGIAGWLPARRASRIDPAAVLRDA